MEDWRAAGAAGAGRDAGGTAWVSALPVGMARSSEDFDGELSACTGGGRWEKALALVGEMQASAVAPSIGVYKHALRACAKADQWRHSLELLDQMQDFGLAPDADSFQIVSDACERGGQWGSTARLWDDMRHAGLSWSSSDVESTIAGCARDFEWARALELFQSSLKSAAAADAAVRNSCLVKTMSVCVHASRWEHVLQLFEDERHQGAARSIAAFSQALAACSKGLQWGRALALLDEMRRESADPDTHNYNSVIGSCAKQQQWQVALFLMHRMQTIGPPPDARTFTVTIAAVSRGFGVGGDDTQRWALALALLQQMMRPEVGSAERLGAVPDATTWSAVINSCARARNWEVALSVLGQMEEASVEPTRVCLHSALSACERGGCWEVALALLERYWESACHVGTLVVSTVVLACQNAGATYAVDERYLRRLSELASSNMMDGRAELGRTTGTAKYGDRNQTLQLAFSPFAHTLLYRSDFLRSSDMAVWRRWAQRPIEQSLRMLHALSDYAARIPGGIRDDRLCNVNDLWPEMTRYALAALGMQGFNAPASSPLYAALRRSFWWQLDRLPNNPEGFFVAGYMKYAIRAEPGGLLMRCPGQIVRWKDWRKDWRERRHSEEPDPCATSFAPINMVKDRLSHRGFHAERVALLTLTFLVLSRHRGEEAGKLRCNQVYGTVWLHATHTPCMSCMGSICQFQALFRRLCLTVTYDIWEEWRPTAMDPWDSRFRS